MEDAPRKARINRKEGSVRLHAQSRVFPSDGRWGCRGCFESAPSCRLLSGFPFLKNRSSPPCSFPTRSSTLQLLSGISWGGKWCCSLRPGLAANLDNDRSSYVTTPRSDEQRYFWITVRRRINSGQSRKTNRARNPRCRQCYVTVSAARSTPIHSFLSLL